MSGFWMIAEPHEDQVLTRCNISEKNTQIIKPFIIKDHDFTITDLSAIDKKCIVVNLYETRNASLQNIAWKEF